MKIEQKQWTKTSRWTLTTPNGLGPEASLVFVFGSRALLEDPARRDEIRSSYPKARIIGCSTAGEICGTRVLDDSIVTTAVRFDKARIESAQVRLADVADSYEAGRTLAMALPPEGLTHVFVLSDGLLINGSQLVQGLSRSLPPGVAVTGGLSGDGARFEHTMVLSDDLAATDGLITAIGLYGVDLKVGYGSRGGWDSFGPERMVTRSKGNVLYELDRKSALGLYKQYLGDYAAGLPSTGLLFPLCVRLPGQETPVVRTILGINETEQCMTFAGDIPEGAYARLMRANFERLIDGATGAARSVSEGLVGSSPDLAILISCVGRKLVLKQRIEEEVEGVREVLGDRAVLAGFYSYGEISPFTPSAKCELHNQTMTITTFREV